MPTPLAPSPTPRAWAATTAPRMPRVPRGAACRRRRPAHPTRTQPRWAAAWLAPAAWECSTRTPGCPRWTAAPQAHAPARSKDHCGRSCSADRQASASPWPADRRDRRPHRGRTSRRASLRSALRARNRSRRRRRQARAPVLQAPRAPAQRDPSRREWPMRTMALPLPAVGPHEVVPAARAAPWRRPQAPTPATPDRRRTNLRRGQRSSLHRRRSPTTRSRQPGPDRPVAAGPRVRRRPRGH